MATAGSFDILANQVGCPNSQSCPNTSSSDAAANARDALRELPVDRLRRQNAASTIPCRRVAHDIKSPPTTYGASASAKPQLPLPASSDLKVKLSRRPCRHRRPPVELETFEPLDAVIEETSFVAEAEARLPVASSLAQQQQVVVQG